MIYLWHGAFHLPAAILYLLAWPCCSLGPFCWFPGVVQPCCLGGNPSHAEITWDVMQSHCQLALEVLLSLVVVLLPLQWRGVRSCCCREPAAHVLQVRR